MMLEHSLKLTYTKRLVIEEDISQYIPELKACGIDLSNTQDVYRWIVGTGSSGQSTILHEEIDEDNNMTSSLTLNEPSLNDSDLDLIFIEGNRNLMTCSYRLTMSELVNHKSLKLPFAVHTWSLEQKSRFIESLLVNIPSPPFIALEGSINNLYLIDGYKRYSCIVNFLSNSFVLQELEVYPELNGRCFDSLPVKIKRSLSKKFINLTTVLNVKDNDYTDEKLLNILKKRYSETN